MEASRLKGDIRRFVVENLALGKDAGSIGDDTSLIENGVIDSLGIFQLVSFLESGFGIRVDDAEIVLENFRTIDDIEQFVKDKLGRKGA
jgi:acyl carrier protein